MKKVNFRFFGLTSGLVLILCLTQTATAEMRFEKADIHFHYPDEPEGGLPPVVIMTPENRQEILKKRAMNFETSESDLPASGKGNAAKKKLRAHTLQSKAYVNRALSAEFSLAAAEQTTVIAFGYKSPADFLYAGVVHGVPAIGAFQNGVFSGGEGKESALKVGEKYQLRVEIRKEDVMLYLFNAAGEQVAAVEKKTERIPEDLGCGTVEIAEPKADSVIEGFRISPLYGRGEFVKNRQRLNKASYGSSRKPDGTSAEINNVGIQMQTQAASILDPGPGQILMISSNSTVMPRPAGWMPVQNGAQ